MSPQVVTETIYALAQQDEFPIETVVTIVTTAEGAKQAHLKLLSGKRPYFNLLKQDYGLEHFQLKPDHVYVVKNKQGEDLSDIRSSDDNILVADLLTETIRQATLDNEHEVHVSIAGGRKSMGYYAGYALSIFGREQDKLSHVYVSEDYEGHPEFFYPTITTDVITTRDNKALDTSKAIITLSDIPFVRMRGELPKEALINKTSFSQAISYINRPTKITLNLSDMSLTFSGTTVDFNASLTVFYIWFIQQKCANDDSFIVCPSEFGGELELSYGQSYLALFDLLVGSINMPDRSRDVLQNEGFLKGPFSVNISKIKAKLEECLGKTTAKKYLIANVGSRGNRCHKLTINQEDIEILGGSLYSHTTSS